MKKLGLLKWQNTWDKLIKQSIIKLGWFTDKTATIEELSSTVAPILAQNMHSNPLFNTYLTVFEQPQK